MTVTINGSGTIGGISVGGLNDNIITKNEMATGGAWAPAGTVLQVVQATTQSDTATTSTAYVPTTITASITPTSTTSKILVVATVPIVTSTSAGGGMSIYRGATKVFDPSALDPSASFYAVYGVSGLYAIYPIQYLDSPASAASVTYTIYISSYNGGTVRAPFNGSSHNATATITLMEIAA